MAPGAGAGAVDGPGPAGGRSSRRAALVPAVAVLSGFAVGALVVIVTGRSPGDMFRALLQAATGVSLRAGAFNPRYLG